MLSIHIFIDHKHIYRMCCLSIQYVCLFVFCGANVLAMPGILVAPYICIYICMFLSFLFFFSGASFSAIPGVFSIYWLWLWVSSRWYIYVFSIYLCSLCIVCSLSTCVLSLYVFSLCLCSLYICVLCILNVFSPYVTLWTFWLWLWVSSRLFIYTYIHTYTHKHIYIGPVGRAIYQKPTHAQGTFSKGLSLGTMYMCYKKNTTRVIHHTIKNHFIKKSARFRDFVCPNF